MLLGKQNGQTSETSSRTMSKLHSVKLYKSKTDGDTTKKGIPIFKHPFFEALNKTSYYQLVEKITKCKDKIRK